MVPPLGSEASLGKPFGDGRHHLLETLGLILEEVGRAGKPREPLVASSGRIVKRLRLARRHALVGGTLQYQDRRAHAPQVLDRRAARSVVAPLADQTAHAGAAAEPAEQVV